MEGNHEQRDKQYCENDDGGHPGKSRHCSDGNQSGDRAAGLERVAGDPKGLQNTLCKLISVLEKDHMSQRSE
ncbi:hypothetical protein SDC9_86369 [bioreactor metagenome]|uniref:Uncharacterized protein n=1 Tax=bioreactor metagenome TaxID=1076179 RepID=A0A644ZFS3_9ZZZZ